MDRRAHQEAVEPDAGRRDSGKTEITTLDTRRKELQVQLETADESPPLLHPEMADLYRQKVTTLAHALEGSDTRSEAREAQRGLIEAITLTPGAGRAQLGNIFTVLWRRGARRRQREIDASSGVLRSVGNRETIGRKGARL